MTDEEIRALARKWIESKGTAGAARAMGVSRGTVLSLAAGAVVTRGTWALVRDRLASGFD